MGGLLSEEHSAVAHTFHTNTCGTPSNAHGDDTQPLLPGHPLSQAPLPFIPAATTGAAETGHGMASGQDGGLRTSNVQRGFHHPAETRRVGHSHWSQPSTSGQHLDGPTHRPIPMPLLLPALMGRRRAAEIVLRSKDVVLLALNELLSPPILSTLVGIIVGCVTPLQVRRGTGEKGMVFLLSPPFILGQCRAYLKLLFPASCHLPGHCHHQTMPSQNLDTVHPLSLRLVCCRSCFSPPTPLCLCWLILRG